MDQVQTWRSPYFLTIFDKYDRADFAQEFLRRSPAYRSQFAAARAGARIDAPLAFERLAAQWGLVFRRRSRP